MNGTRNGPEYPVAYTCLEWEEKVGIVRQNRAGGKRQSEGDNFTLRFHPRIIHEIRFPPFSRVLPHIVTRGVCPPFERNMKENLEEENASLS